MAGNKKTDIKKARIIPIEASIPKFRSAGITEVVSVKNPTTVVKEVNKTLRPTSRITLEIAPLED